MTQPVALTRHGDVIAAAHDPERFSSRTSRHLHVPNGMDDADGDPFQWDDGED